MKTIIRWLYIRAFRAELFSVAKQVRYLEEQTSVPHSGMSIAEICQQKHYTGQIEGMLAVMETMDLLIGGKK